VLVEFDRIMVQSEAIVLYLADTLGWFRAPDQPALQTMREWLSWDLDALTPAIFGCYSVELDRSEKLKLDIPSVIADHHRERAERALASLDAQLAGRDWLSAPAPTIADLFCYGDVAYAELCTFDLARWPNLAAWSSAFKRCGVSRRRSICCRWRTSISRNRGYATGSVSTSLTLPASCFNENGFGRK